MWWFPMPFVHTPLLPGSTPSSTTHLCEEKVASIQKLAAEALSQAMDATKPTYGVGLLSRVAHRIVGRQPQDSDVLYCTCPDAGGAGFRSIVRLAPAISQKVGGFAAEGVAGIAMNTEQEARHAAAVAMLFRLSRLSNDIKVSVAPVADVSKDSRHGEDRESCHTSSADEEESPPPCGLDKCGWDPLSLCGDPALGPDCVNANEGEDQIEVQKTTPDEATSIAEAIIPTYMLESYHEAKDSTFARPFLLQARGFVSTMVRPACWLSAAPLSLISFPDIADRGEEDDDKGEGYDGCVPSTCPTEAPAEAQGEESEEEKVILPQRRWGRAQARIDAEKERMWQ